MTKYRNKTLKFNMEDEADRALWDYLQGLPHGFFSAHTKEMWELTKTMRSTTGEYWKPEPETVKEVVKVSRLMENDPLKVREDLFNRRSGGKIGG